ncbi:MAG: hypothetical protein WC755_09765 [Candidatus Woesearchaeota archaeon]|jgi:hypothetical protein
MLTLTIQTNIEYKSEKDYAKQVNKLIAELEERFDSVDVTSEDENEEE